MNQDDPLPTPLPKTARVIAGAIAVLVLVSLAVQSTLGTGSVFENIAGLLRFFTIWGNVAAGVVMALAASGRRLAPRVMASLATMLTVIGSIYWTLFQVTFGSSVLCFWIFVFLTYYPCLPRGSNQLSCWR